MMAYHNGLFRQQIEKRNRTMEKDDVSTRLSFPATRCFPRAG